jgi:NAD-dependent dihydropyrimidine dehydrogenase PreA subunit
MPYVITEPCIGNKDTACYDVCPVDAIAPAPDGPSFDAHDQMHRPGRLHRMRRLRGGLPRRGDLR